MKIRSNVKAGIGIVGNNHNEKMMDNNHGAIERGKCFIKKLSLKKETIRELRKSDLKQILGGLNEVKYSVSKDKCCGE